MVKFKGVRAAGRKSIEIDFQFEGRRCREKVALVPSPANLARAAEHRAAILRAIEDGHFDYTVTFPNSATAKRLAAERRADTVAGWLDIWLARKEPHLKASTLEGYRKAVIQLKRAFGASHLGDLKKKQVRAWCDGKTSTNKTIANVISVLRAALQDAVDDELIDTNPLTDFRFRRVEPPKPDTVDPFTREEQQAILTALVGQNRNIIQFAFWTGLRTSELIALEWGDIDFDKGTVHVQRAKTAPSSKPETTKTRAGNREVKLLPLALAALLDQRQHTLLAGGRVFKNQRTGQDLRRDLDIREFWKWGLKRAGVRYRNPYQTRHTYASMMLSAGENIAWISRQMGHSSILMTTKAYARYIKDSNPDAGGKAAEMFG